MKLTKIEYLASLSLLATKWLGEKPLRREDWHRFQSVPNEIYNTLHDYLGNQLCGGYGP